MLRISQREKKFLATGGVIAFLILTYYSVTWYRDFRISTGEYIETKRIALQKQLNKISEKEDIQKRLETVSAEVKGLEKGLLSDNRPPVAAADVQKVLKDMALSLGIDIKSERALNPIDEGLYIGVPVEIGFTAPTAKLKDMLLKIKTSPLLLVIAEMKIHVTNINNPVDAHTTLIVKGFIRKPQRASEDKKRAQK